uniref:Uncharacterized protein n=1 Tax=Cryptococcus bacillisporus CA1280 TaxID=1296109 RepID=A0A0D0VC58_CRYGA|nr:hypothetical protein I312_05688 [Cryptococcus bacillisporus CA1280]
MEDSYDLLRGRLVTLAPIAEVHDLILDELSRIAPTKYLLLSRYHYNRILPSLYETFTIPYHYEKALAGTKPFTATKIQAFSHVKQLYIAIGPDAKWQIPEGERESLPSFRRVLTNFVRKHRPVFPQLEDIGFPESLGYPPFDDSCDHNFWDIMFSSIPSFCRVSIHFVKHNEEEFTGNVERSKLQLLYNVASRNLSLYIHRRNNGTTTLNRIITWTINGKPHSALDYHILNANLEDLISPIYGKKDKDGILRVTGPTTESLRNRLHDNLDLWQEDMYKMMFADTADWNYKERYQVGVVLCNSAGSGKISEV